MKFLVVLCFFTATVWFAGNIVLGAVGAPAIFSHAYSGEITKDLAGAIFGDTLMRWTHVVDVGLQVLLGGVLLVLAGVALGVRRHLVMVLCLVALVAVGGLHAWSRATINETRASAPPTEAGKAYSDEQRAAFNVLHLRSERLMIAESLLLLAVAIASGVALCRRSDPVSASALPPTH
jgi:hypothetical protein